MNNNSAIGFGNMFNFEAILKLALPREIPVILRILELLVSAKYILPEASTTIPKSPPHKRE